MHSSSYKQGTTRIAHHSTFHSFRYAHFKYLECLFTNIQKHTLSSCRHTCTHLVILIAGEVERKEKLKNVSVCGKFSFHVRGDRELFTYVKNKKKLILIVNKKFKIVHGTISTNSMIFLID